MTTVSSDGERLALCGDNLLRDYPRGVGCTEGLGTGDGHAEKLFAVAHALTAALTPDDVASAVFERALVDLGASTAGLWQVRGDAIRFAGGAGHIDDSPYRVGEIPLDSDLPAAVSVRTLEVVAYGSEMERDQRWPSLTGLGGSAEAVAVVPLVTEDRALGCLHIGYNTPISVADMDIPLLERLAGICATALRRSERFEEEREERTQLEFFSDATRALIQSLDPDEVLEALVDTAVPRLAPWCAVLSPEGNELKTVAVRIAGGDGRLARATGSEVYSLSGDIHVARCFRTGRMEVAERIPGDLLSGGEGRTETSEALEDAGIGAALVIPIPWGGRPIGVLLLGFSDPAHATSERLQETAEGLALRAGVALHNASRYDAERTVARTLTEALLPPTVPSVPGYEAAVRYLPASGDVAGDWYDLFDIGGRFVVGVGDSAGHGIRAATVMAELRNAARGLAAAGLSPSEILDDLAVVADYDRQDMFATAVYGILDPTLNTLDWALAGHPPPIFVAGGRAVMLGQEPPGAVFGTPIASGVRAQRSEQQLDLLPGETIVLYTDGVIERRFASLDQGLAKLMDLIRDLSEVPVETVAGRIIDDLCGDAADDCCVMVLRRSRQPSG